MKENIATQHTKSINNVKNITNKNSLDWQERPKYLNETFSTHLE